MSHWVIAFRPLGEPSLDEARRLFDVRFWGAVTAVRHAAPRIRAGCSVVLTPGSGSHAHLYLMDNRFVTGTVLTVDGGAVLL